jgi:hypothetical protein
MCYLYTYKHKGCLEIGGNKMTLTPNDKALIHTALSMLANDIRNGNSLQVKTDVDSVNELIFKVIK